MPLPLAVGEAIQKPIQGVRSPGRQCSQRIANRFPKEIRNTGLLSDERGHIAYLVLGLTMDQSR
jgi:hypothetical protein